jgi:hypothetical protein
MLSSPRRAGLWSPRAVLDCCARLTPHVCMRCNPYLVRSDLLPCDMPHASLARGRLLPPDLDTVCRRYQRHRVIEHRGAALKLLGRVDPRAVTGLDSADVWRDDL